MAVPYWKQGTSGGDTYGVLQPHFGGTGTDNPGAINNVLTSLGNGSWSAMPVSATTPGVPLLSISMDWLNSGSYQVQHGDGGTVNYSPLNHALVTTNGNTDDYVQVNAKFIGPNNNLFYGGAGTTIFTAMVAISNPSGTMTGGQAFVGFGSIGMVDATGVTFNSGYGFAFKNLGGNVLTLYGCNGGTLTSALTTLGDGHSIFLCYQINSSGTTFWWSKDGGTWNSATLTTTNSSSLFFSLFTGAVSPVSTTTVFGIYLQATSITIF